MDDEVEIKTINVEIDEIQEKIYKLSGTDEEFELKRKLRMLQKRRMKLLKRRKTRF